MWPAGRSAWVISLFPPADPRHAAPAQRGYGKRTRNPFHLGRSTRPRSSLGGRSSRRALIPSAPTRLQGPEVRGLPLGTERSGFDSRRPPPKGEQDLAGARFIAPLRGDPWAGGAGLPLKKVLPQAHPLVRGWGRGAAAARLAERREALVSLAAACLRGPKVEGYRAQEVAGFDSPPSPPGGPKQVGYRVCKLNSCPPRGSPAAPGSPLLRGESRSASLVRPTPPAPR